MRNYNNFKIKWCIWYGFFRCLLLLLVFCVPSPSFAGYDTDVEDGEMGTDKKKHEERLVEVYPGRRVLFVSYSQLPMNIVEFGSSQDVTKKRRYYLNELPEGMYYYEANAEGTDDKKVLVVDREYHNLQGYSYIEFQVEFNGEVQDTARINFITQEPSVFHKTLFEEREYSLVEMKIPYVLQKFMENQASLTANAGTVMRLPSSNADDVEKIGSLNGVYFNHKTGFDLTNLRKGSSSNGVVVFLDKSVGMINITELLHASQQVYKGSIIFCGVDTDNGEVRLYALDKLFLHGGSQIINSGDNDDSLMNITGSEWRLLEKSYSPAIAYTPSFFSNQNKCMDSETKYLAGTVVVLLVLGATAGCLGLYP